jgi:transposase
LTDEQSRRLTEHFVAGTPARTAAELVGVNRNTARLFYHRMRELIARHLAQDSPFEEDKVALDESTLESPERPGRRPSGKLPVFALLKHGGKVYTAMVLDARPEAPAPPTRLKPDSVVYADPPSPDGTLGVSRFQHRRAAGNRQHRELLEPGQAPHAPLQWHSAPPLPPVPQGMRMALQLRIAQAVVD